MERLPKKLEIFKPKFIEELESQIGRFMPAITPGIKHEKILDIEDSGLLLFHQGPERRIILGFPAKEFSTGKESVFLEYHRPEGSFHLVGNVGKTKQFTFLRLEQYRQGKGYCRVGIRKYEEVIRNVTGLLRDIEAPQL